MDIEKNYENWVNNFYAKYSLGGKNKLHINKLLQLDLSEKRKILRCIKIIKSCNNYKKSMILRDFIENKANDLLIKLINKNLSN